MKNHRIMLAALLGIMIYTGCAPNATQDAQPSTNLTPSLEASGEITTPDRINPTMTNLPERIPPTEENTPVTGEAPTDLLTLVKNDLSKRTGIALDVILVIQDQEVVWNDGALGCAQPGVFYTQAQVKGYWIILEAEDVRYDYRATASGYFFLCEGGLPPAVPQATPDS